MEFVVGQQVIVRTVSRYMQAAQLVVDTIVSISPKRKEIKLEKSNMVFQADGWHKSSVPYPGATWNIEHINDKNKAELYLHRARNKLSKAFKDEEAFLALSFDQINQILSILKPEKDEVSK